MQRDGRRRLKILKIAFWIWGISMEYKVKPEDFSDFNQVFLEPVSFLTYIYYSRKNKPRKPKKSQKNPTQKSPMLLSNNKPQRKKTPNPDRTNPNQLKPSTNKILTYKNCCCWSQINSGGEAAVNKIQETYILQTSIEVTEEM